MPEKTHCPRGHVFDDANTGWMAGPSGRRRRYCRECDRERRRVERIALAERLKRAVPA